MVADRGVEEGLAGGGGWPGGGGGGGGGGGFFANNPHVTEITSGNANDYISKTARGNDGRNWVVMFYAPWCGHCRHAKPEFERFARRAAGVVRVGAVDCDANQDLCQRYRVQGFPTIYNLALSGPPVPHQGARDAASFYDFATRLVPDAPIDRADSREKAEQACAAKQKPCVVLLSDKSAPTPLYKSLARRNLARAAFAFVRSPKATQPELFVNGNKYAGSFAADDIHKFIGQAAAASAKRSAGAKREDL